MSASIETRVDAFIQEHELDTDIKEDVQNLVIGCIEDMFKTLFNVPIPVQEDPKKTKKVLKADKIEDPATVESIEELRNCTTGILNQYCRDHNLKIGGNKKEIMDRVWRHIQGESSDEDKSSRGKPKKEKRIAEKHVCSGFKLDGTPCQISGTEEKDGCFFCYKHIADADKFIGAQKKGESSTKKKSKKVESDDEDDETPAPPPSRKAKGKKAVIAPVPQETEELESEEE